MKFLDYAGVQRLWAAITAKVEAEVANASAPAPGADYLVSNDRNLIVTHEFTAGVADAALAAIPGESNVVKGFVSGEDNVRVPLALLQSLNADTALAAGPLPSGKLGTTAGADMLLYEAGVLSYCATGATDATPILTLADAPALAATDITIA